MTGIQPQIQPLQPASFRQRGCSDSDKFHRRRFICSMSASFHLRFHQFPADHGRSKLLRARFSRVEACSTFPLPKDHDPVADCHDLMQFMCNDQDGHPVFLELPQKCKQCVRLLRRQYSRWFVQDQDPAAAVQRLQYLHPLFCAQRQRGHHAVRLYIHVIPLAKRTHFLIANLIPVEKAAYGLFCAEDHVLCNGERLYKLQMLVYHRDPAFNRLLRRIAHRHFPSINGDRAGISLIKAEEDIHQRAFSRAVFSKQRNDLAFLRRQRNIIVCPKVLEAFHDIS